MAIKNNHVSWNKQFELNFSKPWANLPSLSRGLTFHLSAVG